MSVTKDVLTIDNLLHALVAVAFVTGWWALGHFTMLSLLVEPHRHLGNGIGSWEFIGAGLAGIGLYLREAAQVGWDFTLRLSMHKHLEWLVGAAAGLVAASILTFVG